LRDHAEQIDALVAAAPPPIQSQVALLIESIRARAGARTEPLDRQSIIAAEDAVEQWERANCPG
ncbi:MAG TPA: hypothetical protein VHF58_02530, partial [Solirubrobacterales bacterium]|nr:hypothetical protein [Solirubrobacterales bacterium]